MNTIKFFFQYSSIGTFVKIANVIFLALGLLVNWKNAGFFFKFRFIFEILKFEILKFLNFCFVSELTFASIDWSTKLSIDHSINQSFDRVTDRSIKLSMIDRSIEQSLSLKWSIDRSKRGCRPKRAVSGSETVVSGPETAVSGPGTLVSEPKTAVRVKPRNDCYESQNGCFGPKKSKKYL